MHVIHGGSGCDVHIQTLKLRSILLSQFCQAVTHEAQRHESTWYHSPVHNYMIRSKAPGLCLYTNILETRNNGNPFDVKNEHTHTMILADVRKITEYNQCRAL